MAQALFLNDAEQRRLQTFPTEISRDDLAAYFLLSRRDLAEVRKIRGDTNRLGFGLLLGALRLLGFAPARMNAAPTAIIEFVATQLALPPNVEAYPASAKTRTSHLNRAAEHLGFRRATRRDLAEALKLVTAQAAAHARPTALLSWLMDHLHRGRIVRPGLSTLQHMVIKARRAAEERCYQDLGAIIDTNHTMLQNLLEVDEELGRTRLAWLRDRERTNSPRAIRNMLDKHEWLEQSGVALWDLREVQPNRLRYLARLGDTANPQMMRRMPPRRRLPALVAYLRQALVRITDELIDMFDRNLGETHARARREMAEQRRQADRARDDVVTAFITIADVILREEQPQDLRRALLRRVPKAELQRLRDACQGPARALDTEGLDFLESRYSYIRQFSKRLLAQLDVSSSDDDAPVLGAVRALRDAEQSGGQLADDSPVEFVPRRWRPFVITDQGIDRRYYELCTLWHLRGALRDGSAWVRHSRRFAPLNTYTIPRTQWRRTRSQIVPELGAPKSPARALDAKAKSLQALEEAAGAACESGPLRMDEGRVIVPPVTADQAPQSLLDLQATMEARLPRVDLASLLVEVDRWTHLTRHLRHAGEDKPPRGRAKQHVLAAVLAQACNVGLTRMADAASMSFDQLAWANTWYLTEATLKNAFSAIVDHHHRQPLSTFWGAGTLSSSDGQRFPVRGSTAAAAALPRYFGYGRGLTFYTWTSDQFSQFGTKVISATSRDATYVLDEILDNETELEIVEHTTDTAGYTDLVFALFDLLGLRFAPRIRDSASTRLYRLEGAEPRWANFVPSRVIKRETITKHWDEMLRVAASLKTGHVTASMLIGKLQGRTDRGVGRALVDYGRLCKTEHVLRYYATDTYRRRISRQLNKGEALHAVRRFLVFGNLARLGPGDLDALGNQAACLNLVTNAVVLWNTVYMGQILDTLRAEGRGVREEDVQHLSPARYAHINPYGRYRFDDLPPAGSFRPIRA